MKALALVALAISACAAPTEPRRSVPPTRPHPDIIYADAPPTPTAVSATVTADDGVRATIHLQWLDNDADPTEWVTCARVTLAATDAPVTTQCAYASEYDPTGSTGARAADIVVPAGGPYVARLWSARHFLQPDGWWRDTYSGESAAIAVAPLVVSTTTKKGKR